LSRRACAVIVTLALVPLLVSCASALRYRYQPRLTAPGADIPAALTIAGGNEAVDGNEVTVLENGDAIFPAMLDAIRQARSSVHLETFIFNDGVIGREFVATLAARSRAGVAVRLLLDGLGSTGLGASNEKTLTDAGVHLVFFNPLGVETLFKVHLRTHRKLLIVDGRVAFTGGVCIDDEWAGNADSPDRWRDSMVQVEGPVVRQMQAAFARAWVEATSELLSDRDLFPQSETRGSLTCQVMESVPGFHGNPARLSFLVAAASAQHSILITNAYFVPDEVALDTLEKAAGRGVKIRLLLPSRHTDHKSVRYAGRSMYGRLLRLGVEVWEYESSRLHSKTMVVDGRWSSIGSTNLDRRSFFWNYESNLNVFDEHFAAVMTRTFEADLSKSSQVTLEAWKKRPLSEKLAEFWYGLLRSQY
jgi:cardiolipin synthase A/B